MLIRSRTAFVRFGVPSAADKSIAVTIEDWPTVTAPAAPSEAESPQLLAAEQLGMFTYPHASDGHPMLGHTA